MLGVVAAILLGAGFVLQQGAAQQAPTSHFLRLGLLADLLRKPRWLAGLGTMVAGQLLSAWVIGHMELSLAEPLLATNLLYALVLAGPVSRQAVHRSEIAGAVILIAGVTALSVARVVHAGQVSLGRPAYWPYAGAAAAAAAFGLARLGRSHSGELRATLTGASAGVVFGLQDALTRRTVAILSTHGITALLASWPGYCLILVGITGLWLMQSAFNAAPLHASLPAITAGEPITGIVLGIVVFGDSVNVSPGMIALQLGGFAALVLGVIMVARAPALAGRVGMRHHDGRQTGAELPGRDVRDRQQAEAPGPQRQPGQRGQVRPE
ncbi:MAG: DMT family transporter [Micromonosporaceae bacterium]